MNKRFLSAAILLLLLLASCTSMAGGPEPQAGPVTLDRSVVKPYQNAYAYKWINYLMYIPPEYPESEKEYPLILYFHGAGQKGSDPQALTQVSLNNQLENSKKENFPYIVVSPQLPGPEGFEWPYSMDRGTWYPDSFYPAVMEMVDHIIRSYAVDPSRIYVHGTSMGGTATWKMAMYYPDRFAAAAPCAGEANPEDAALLKDVPLWVFHAEGDEIMPVANSDAMVEAVREAGGEVTYVRPDGGNHQSAWANEFPELYKWFLNYTLD